MKLIKKITVAVLIIATVALNLVSCGLFSKQKFTKHSFECFDTLSTVIGYEYFKGGFDTIAERIVDRLLEYHRLYDIYNEYDGITNLATLNKAAGRGVALKVDKKIVDLLLFAKEAHTLTGGEVNVAFGSVLSLWHDCRVAAKADPDEATLPSPSALLSASMNTDISKIVIDEKSSTVEITDPGVKIDVGAVAKGYATEMVARELENEGISGYILNIGGNVRVVGSNPDGEPFGVGIEDPRKGNTDYLAIVGLRGASVVTSGSYQRFFTVGGKNYHHIIDKDTLYPAEGYVSVSVICPDSGLADVLSTALFLMSLDAGEDLINSIDGAEALWLLPDGIVKTTKGFNAFEVDK